MRRKEHPLFCWLTEHLADLVLLCFTTPIAFAALVLHFL